MCGRGSNISQWCILRNKWERRESRGKARERFCHKLFHVGVKTPSANEHEKTKRTKRILFLFRCMCDNLKRIRDMPKARWYYRPIVILYSLYVYIAALGAHLCVQRKRKWKLQAKTIIDICIQSWTNDTKTPCKETMKMGKFTFNQCSYTLFVITLDFPEHRRETTASCYGFSLCCEPCPDLVVFVYLLEDVC